MTFENKLYTTFEVADIFKMHPVTVRNAVREGQIKATKIGRNYLFTAAALNEFFNSCSTEAA